MRLTVLGSSASYAGAGRACAGYLVSGSETCLMVDCGHGALANASRVLDPATLDALVLSHMHPDHVADTYALQALLRYAPYGPLPPLSLHAPQGALTLLGRLLHERGAAELSAAFKESALVDGHEFEVGALRVTPHAVEHTGETYALVIVDGKGRKLCYSSDSTACEALVAAAEGADLLLAEATMPEKYAGMAPHMTAREAARVARAAGAGRLVLTHVWPTSDRGAILDEAREEFGGDVSVASELDAYDL